MATAFCAFCGTQNFGTRFCENCGQPAGAPAVAVAATTAAAPSANVASASLPAVNPYAVPAVPPTYPYTAAAGTAVRRGSPLNVVTLVSYLTSSVVSTLGFLVLSAADYYSVQAGYVIVQILTLVLLLICGISATIAGFTSKTTPGRRVGGGLLGVFFLLLWLLEVIATFTGSSIVIYIAAFSPIALFLSWAIARPFRGPGYFALLIGIALTLLVGIVPVLLGGRIYDMYGLFSLLSLIGTVTATIVTVVVALAFERPRHGTVPNAVAPGVVSAQPGYSAYGARTNSLAIVSLVFGIVGGSLVAVILGHIAMSQIRRTGEQGSGMAIAGLILGYFWFVVLTIVVIIQIVSWIALTNAISSFGSYGY